MGAFEQFDTSAAKSSDTATGALFSDAYSSSAVNQNPEKLEAKLHFPDLPKVTIKDEDVPEFKRQIDEMAQKENLAKYDTNKDGKIDDNEYSTAIANSKDLSEIWKLGELKRYDKNHDGKIDDKEDVQRMNDQFELHQERLKKYDKNKDGKLDDKEQLNEINDILRPFGLADKTEKQPLKEEELKKEIDRGVEDMKKGIAANDMTAVIQDLEKAKQQLPPDQYAKYLKAVNDEFHKHNPNADIVGPFEQNGKHQLEVRSKSGDVTVFVNPNEVKRALEVKDITVK